MASCYVYLNKHSIYIYNIILLYCNLANNLKRKKLIPT